MEDDAVVRGSMAWRLVLFAGLISLIVIGGCAERHIGSHHKEGHHDPSLPSQGKEARGDVPVDERLSLGLDLPARLAHTAIMRTHLEAVHGIVAALAREDFVTAREITENELGFAKHREAMRLQKPEHFPADYHDLAMAHHRAAEDLAGSMGSNDIKQVLPQLERTLQACVDCHRVYKQ
jgi:hypothetical protein